MKVALVAPFPVRQFFGQRLAYSTARSIEHPATWVINCIKLLSQQEDIDLHIVTLSPHLSRHYRLVEDRAHYHLLKGGHYLGQIACLYQPDRLRLTAELRQIRPDVIEAFGTEGPYAYAAVSSGLPCVVYIQGIITEILKTMDVAPANPQWIHHFLTQFFERWTIRRGKYYIVENEFGARFVKQLNPDSKSFVLPNIINPLFFQTQSAPADQKPEILFVGRLSILKGCLELIRAFEVIRAARPETRLTLIGDVSPEVMRTIQLLPLHVQESINICGRQDQPFIMNKMQAKPIFVCPSRMDSSPNSVYEAMAAGLPVVATRAGGLPYMIESGTTGYITDPLDPDSLAERILYLLDHPDERRRLGANASRVTRERLSSQKIVQELINIYRQVCAQQ